MAAVTRTVQLNSRSHVLPLEDKVQLQFEACSRHLPGRATVDTSIRPAAAGASGRAAPLTEARAFGRQRRGRAAQRAAGASSVLSPERAILCKMGPGLALSGGRG